MANRYNPQTVIDIFYNEIGYLEKRKNTSNTKLYDKTANAGTDNWTKYWLDLSKWGLGNYQGSYWCAAFVTWCFYKAYGMNGARELLFKLPFISCQNFYELALSKEKELGRQIVYTTPKVGDIVVFWNGNRMHHTEYVIYARNDTYKTIGGNTAANSDIPNGGGVYGPKIYSITASKSLGHKFIRPYYNYAEEKWIQLDDGNWKYQLSDGEYVTSAWRYIKDRWYIFDAAGIMITGWYKSGEYMYYMCPNGCMETGWQKIDGIWYYFTSSGEMVKDWLQDGDVWYYLKDGKMISNCICEINGCLYAFKEDGVMYCEEWYQDGQDWYYFGSSGAAYTNKWKQLEDGRFYYLLDNGKMARDTYIQSEVNSNLYYYVDGSGAWDTTKDKVI